MSMAAVSLSENIQWKDPRLCDAFERLKEIPGGNQTIKDVGIDYLVAGFLASNNFDAETALERLRETAVWRQTNGAATARAKIREAGWSPCDFPLSDTLRKFMPFCQGGKAVDKRGLPYAIRCAGRTDTDALYQHVSDVQVTEWQLFGMEWRLMKLEEYAIRTGCLGDIVIVQDLHAPEGLWNVWFKNRDKVHVLGKIATRMEIHYPGVVGKMFLVNVPWAIHAILLVVSPLVPKRFMARIELIPPALVASKLLEFVDAEALPSFLGGSGINEEFIPGHDFGTEASTSGLSLVVNARAKETRSIALEAGDLAIFGFRVEGAENDINFGCHFQADDASAEIQVVRSPGRVVEDGGGSTFVAPQKGTFIMLFDNSYSWINAKTIHFELFRSDGVASRLTAESISL